MNRQTGSAGRLANLRRLAAAERSLPQLPPDTAGQRSRFASLCEADPCYPLVERDFRLMQLRLWEQWGLTLAEADSLLHGPIRDIVESVALSVWLHNDPAGIATRQAWEGVEAYLDETWAEAA